MSISGEGLGTRWLSIGAACILSIVITALIIVIHSSPTLACEVTAGCNLDGSVSGSVEIDRSDSPTVFTVFVEDRCPGQDYWVPIPGSFQSVEAPPDTTSVAFGPLDVSQHRACTNSMRVAQTITNQKSDPLTYAHPYSHSHANAHPYSHSHVHAYSHVYTHTYAHSHVYTYTYAHSHVYTHTYAHTGEHTHGRSPGGSRAGAHPDTHIHRWSFQLR